MADWRPNIQARSKRASRAEPEVVRVKLLGDFIVSVGTRIVDGSSWRRKKAASLVKLLALAPAHRLHREQAMDLLWPASGRKSAANSLRQALHAARRTLAPDSESGSRYLRSKDDQILLCPERRLWVDVEAFEEAAHAARRSRDPATYSLALDLYAGELLPADRYEEWAEEHRSRLRETYVSTLVRLARLHEERAEYAAAADTYRRVLTEESAREEAHVGLMRVHAVSGRKAEALKQYAQLDEVLLKELGTGPAASSRALREEISTGRFPSGGDLPPASPPDKPPETTRHNLPARTSFVGRRREILEVKRELAVTRHLTLTGAGGSGKTRLALEIARGLVGAYPEGVWLVELAPLSDGELVPQSVAEALGVRERPGQPPTDVLAQTLRPWRTLLILGNCEHVVAAAARLADALLDACPGLRILATSREPLGVAGEVRWQVPPLAVPDPRTLPTAGDLEGYESAGLFAERARQHSPAFALRPGNAAAVTNICRRLEGMPLAIELAAARIGVLSAQQISVRLEDSLKLLTGGGRTETTRQRTLRGTLEWSYALLREPERQLSEHSPSSRAAGPSRQPRQWRPAVASRRTTFWTSSPGWWTSRWWWRKPSGRVGCATGC